MVKKRLDAFKYPVLTLPYDITSEIFINFLPPYPECPPLVGRLSPLWRAVQLDGEKIPRSINLRNIWLSRAGKYALSVRVDAYCNGDEPLRKAKDLLAAILPYRTRWEHADLGIENAMDGFDGKLDFSDAPLLRSVELNVCAAEGIKLPWTQLTSFELYNTYLDGCVEYLQKATNLQHCYLSLCEIGDSDDEYEPTIPRIELAHLESLIVTGDFPNRSSRLLHFPDIEKRLQAATSAYSGRRKVCADVSYRKAFPLTQFVFDAENSDDEDSET
ncbi:F-box domain-containing protein [Favolaschia claudopus]|uniref:F-box domain-containing protein n=1 Tax=Favolaschia claudopus TaxID=2862362 RepID=A0AAW0CAC1_9AGAR